MSAALDLPSCGGWTPRWLARLRRALHPSPRRCEVRPDWLDDDGLAGAPVPRRPRGPRPSDAVALELPDDPRSDPC